MSYVLRKYNRLTKKQISIVIQIIIQKINWVKMKIFISELLLQNNIGKILNIAALISIWICLEIL